MPNPHMFRGSAPEAFHDAIEDALADLKVRLLQAFQQQSISPRREDGKSRVTCQAVKAQGDVDTPQDTAEHDASLHNGTTHLISRNVTHQKCNASIEKEKVSVGKVVTIPEPPRPRISTSSTRTVERTSVKSFISAFGSRQDKKESLLASFTSFGFAKSVTPLDGEYAPVKPTGATIGFRIEGHTWTFENGDTHEIMHRTEKFVRLLGDDHAYEFANGYVLADDGRTWVKQTPTTTKNLGSWLRRTQSVYRLEVPTHWDQMLSDHQDSVSSATIWRHACVVVDTFSAMMVLLNLAFLGWQLQHRFSTGRNLESSALFDILFCISLMFEIFFRLMMERRTFETRSIALYCGNLFDIVIFIGMVSEAVIGLAMNDDGNHVAVLRILSFLRLIRIFRVVKVFRMLALLRSGRLLVMSLVNGCIAIFWIAVLSFTLAYAFSLVVSSRSVDHCSGHDVDHQLLCKHFGSVWRSLSSIYQAMLGGIRWGILYEAMEVLDPFYNAAFLVFITFYYCVFLQIVTGIFVVQVNSEHKVFLAEDAARLYRSSREQRKFIAELHRHFKRLDVNQNGVLCREEMQEIFHNEDMAAFFSKYELDTTSATTFFELLDSDKSGSVDFSEFASGCLKFRGAARSVDLALLKQDFQKLQSKIGSMLGMEGPSCPLRGGSVPSNPLGTQGSRAIRSTMPSAGKGTSSSKRIKLGAASISCAEEVEEEWVQKSMASAETEGRGQKSMPSVETEGTGQKSMTSVETEGRLQKSSASVNTGGRYTKSMASAEVSSIASASDIESTETNRRSSDTCHSLSVESKSFTSDFKPLNTEMSVTDKPTFTGKASSKDSEGRVAGTIKQVRRSFSMLASSSTKNSGVIIEKTEMRAMLLQELQDVVSEINLQCDAEEWMDTRSGKRLHPRSVNLYDFNFYTISPRTAATSVTVKGLQMQFYPAGGVLKQYHPSDSRILGEAQIIVDVHGTAVEVRILKGQLHPNFKVYCNSDECGAPERIEINGKSISYKELVSTAPARPDWFCSHWWGEPINDFVACCREHSKKRKKDKYWVCAYANRQHELGSDISMDPEETSFRKAMKLAEGVLLVLDTDAIPFRRIWCDYEIFKTVSEQKKLDIVTFTDTPHLLTEKPLPHESTFDKTRRERQFPLEVLQKGLRVELENGSATMEQDKTNILNCMGKAVNEDLYKKNVDYANRSLRGYFAMAAWPQAIKRNLVRQFPFFGGAPLDLSQILHEDEGRKFLQFTLSGFKEMNDTEMMSIAACLPPCLSHFNLSVENCVAVTDTGVCSIAAKLQSLPLQTLELDFVSCDLSDKSLVALASHLPSTLVEVKLHFDHNSRISKTAVKLLAEKLPSGVKTLTATFNKTACNESFSSVKRIRQL